jgi:hypothetical protein
MASGFAQTLCNPELKWTEGNSFNVVRRWRGPHHFSV